jgi:GNAT superfamily N-acetyltransferase
VTVDVRPVGYLEALFEPLFAEAAAEDAQFLFRLRDEWESGELRFDGEGELLLGAFRDERLVGCGGISFDPYNPRPGLGRVRHVYVLSGHRGQGIGRLLMERLLAHARRHFRCLRLTTQRPEAAGLYVSLGFAPVGGPKQTHRLEL